MASTPEVMQVFESGANRSHSEGKPDFEGFLSPLVIERYGEYMNQNRQLPDGTTRASDNWQQGIPLRAYMTSGWRHFQDWWGYHRYPAFRGREALEDSLCAVIFNASGYLFELLKQRRYNQSET